TAHRRGPGATAGHQPSPTATKPPSDPRPPSGSLEGPPGVPAGPRDLPPSTSSTTFAPAWRRPRVAGSISFEPAWVRTDGPAKPRPAAAFVLTVAGSAPR